MDLVILGLVNYLYILFRSLQSRAINHAKYQHIAVVGSLIGMCEVFYISEVSTRGFSPPVVAIITTSGILACMSSVYITRGYHA